MFAKCFAAVLLCATIMGSHQQVVVPAYSAAYYPSAYAYPSVYSPYVSAYPSVWAWGSNKNKDDAPRAFSRPSLINKPSA
ncbi:Nematode Specific Peptide family, group B [Caenorhabditis elegans]|uniref:Nematode Specific Peptide family, group B n=1 Tax=Caenorhabditis elegans TaxID=6239 RepID=O45234_CAEEL|nr:Nematode Specific Peptide family, group B [Caenorhabditis elegans]CAB03813.2 Nematode Specific Peptide family, group B [Caenorhabditis elegans]|eukprot:NP_497029.2 Nematode Specific Peptide family, group B [Caenorhabditis elegans]